jgi:hypothetical protein
MNVITFWLIHGKGSNQNKASSGNHEDRFIFQNSATTKLDCSLERFECPLKPKSSKLISST